jgi:proteasome lid subunit RPN8/RPN11
MNEEYIRAAAHRLTAQYEELTRRMYKPGLVEIAPVRPAGGELLRLQVAVDQPTYVAGPQGRPVRAERFEFFLGVRAEGTGETFAVFFRDAASCVTHPLISNRSGCVHSGAMDYAWSLTNIVRETIRVCLFDPEIYTPERPYMCSAFVEWYAGQLKAGAFPTGDLCRVLDEGEPVKAERPADGSEKLAGAYRPPRALEDVKPCFPALSAEEIVERIYAHCGVSGVRTHNAAGADPEYQVVFTPQGWRELQAVFHWGMEHPDNQWEQQARLLGHYARSKSGAYTTVVCYVQPIYPARRSPVSAAIIDSADADHHAGAAIYAMLNDNLKVMQECEPIARRRAAYRELDPLWEQDSLRVCGLAHTHPHMACFPSGTDRRNHAAPKGEPYISLIVNPQGQDMFAMADYAMRPARIRVLSGEATAAAREPADTAREPGAPVMTPISSPAQLRDEPEPQPEERLSADGPSPLAQWKIVAVVVLVALGALALLTMLSAWPKEKAGATLPEASAVPTKVWVLEDVKETARPTPSPQATAAKSSPASTRGPQSPETAQATRAAAAKAPE